MQVSNPSAPSQTVAGTTTSRIPLAKFATTGATPQTIWSRALTAGLATQVLVDVVAHNDAGNLLAEFRARCAFSRSSGGVSARLGSTNGVQDSVGNNFGVPRPSISFGDPSATNTITVIAAGKAGTTIDWAVTVTYTEGT